MRNNWTKEELINALSDFKEAILFIKQNKGVWYSTVGECDKAFCDIRHQIENNYPTDRASRTKACQLIRDYSKKRREAKDMMLIFTELAELSEKDTQNLCRIINQAKNKYAYTESDRIYTNRIIENLW